MPNSKLIKKADKIFGLYIKLRDSNENGYGNCITSGMKIHISQGDPGHYISRRHLHTRFNEANCHLQAKGQNLEQSLNDDIIYEYAYQIKQRYGKDVLDWLHTKAKSTEKITDYQLKIIIQHYKKKCRELAKEKNFEINLY